MSEEVNLSEESNNPEEVLAQKELLEDVVEIRQMIHQQRFAECNPMLFAIIKNSPNHQPYIHRLVQGLLSTVIASLSLFQRKKISTEMLGFLKLDAKAVKEFKIPETTPEGRAKLVSEAISELDQFLVDIEMDIRSEQGIFKDLKKQGEAIDIKEVKPTLEKFVSREAMLFLNHDLSKEEQDQASARLYQEWEEYREKIFDRFVSSGYWNDEERAVVKDTILSPTVDSLTSQLLVSAITLSAATVFDMGKFTLLYDIYRQADDDEVKVRALLGWLLVSMNSSCYEQHPDFLSFAEQLTKDCKNDSDLLAEIIKAQKMLAVTVFSEQKSIDYTNDIMSSLAKRFIGELKNKVADYIVTGQWAKKAYQEAQKYGKANKIASSEDKTFSYIPDCSDLPISPDADYVYICENNTIYGTKFKKLPNTKGKTLVADVSSCFLSEPVDVSKYGIIYGGVQKNIGPAGMVISIIREDLITDDVLEGTPTMLKFKTQADAGSLYNTPNCYCIYVCGKVFKWLKKMGGLEEMQRRNIEKAKILYDFLDQSKLFKGTVVPEDRSLMNVPFVTGDKDMDAKFVKEAKEAGLVNLKGHRTVGGMRASIYNAMPKEGVEALVAFMKKFEEENA